MTNPPATLRRGSQESVWRERLARHILVERTLTEYGVQRRQLFRVGHLLDIPDVIAATDLVVTVPVVVGQLFVKLANVKIIQPPYTIPPIEVKHYWHRCQQNDPGNRWLRGVFVTLFGDAKAGSTRRR